MLVFWGRGLFVGGLVAALLSAAPALLLSQLPPSQSTGFYGLLAGLLVLSVTPLSAVVASAGALLLLWALLRRWRS